MPHWLEISIFAITQVVMLVGLFGLLIPIFPGIVVMWLAALGYGVVTGFGSTLAIVLFVIITLLMLAGTLVDNVLMSVEARQAGASWLSIGAALVAGVLGTLLVPPIGGLVAAPVTVLLMEYWRRKDWQQAVLALQGLARGWGLSFFARFGIGTVMMVLWWLWAWKG